jgi:kynurenine formamidase
MRQLLAITILLAVACDDETTPTIEPRSAVAVPVPPWPANDELGNGNTQGYATRLRCAPYLADATASLYELSHELSSTMPQNIFASAPLAVDFVPTFGVPFVRQVANGEIVSGEIGQQGTQFDALGHFGVLPDVWNPFIDPQVPSQSATYYNGYTQAQVKPDPEAGLALLGVENAPPIITSAVLFDAKEHFGSALEAGDLITADDIDDMIDASHALRHRGLLPGDAVFIRTGWGERWTDPQTDPSYYVGSPGLSADAIERLAQDVVVLVALDNAFTDAFAGLCELDGSCPPPDASLLGIPFPAHHLDLVVHGIHQIQNLALTEAADADIELGCTMVLPLPVHGAAGSPVRVVMIGR